MRFIQASINFFAGFVIVFHRSLLPIHMRNQENNDPLLLQDSIYYFGLRSDSAWERKLPFSVNIEHGTLKWSWQSIVTRVRFAIYMLFFIAMIIIVVYTFVSQ